MIKLVFIQIVLILSFQLCNFSKKYCRDNIILCHRIIVRFILGRLSILSVSMRSCQIRFGVSINLLPAAASGGFVRLHKLSWVFVGSNMIRTISYVSALLH